MMHVVGTLRDDELALCLVFYQKGSENGNTHDLWDFFQGRNKYGIASRNIWSKPTRSLGNII